MAAKNLPITMEEIEERVEKIPECGCWIWMGATRDGYGVIKRHKKQKSVHRLLWELFFHKEIPIGMQACHHCDTPSCVKPHHVFLGTNADNTQDMIRKGRKFITFGDTNGQPKLTNEKVRKIRSLNLTQNKIAKLFRVSETTISLIRTRKRWNHI